MVPGEQCWPLLGHCPQWPHCALLLTVSTTPWHCCMKTKLPRHEPLADILKSYQSVALSLYLNTFEWNSNSIDLRQKLKKLLGVFKKRKPWRLSCLWLSFSMVLYALSFKLLLRLQVPISLGVSPATCSFPTCTLPLPFRPSSVLPGLCSCMFFHRVSCLLPRTRCNVSWSLSHEEYDGLSPCPVTMDSSTWNAVAFLQCPLYFCFILDLESTKILRCSL